MNLRWLWRWMRRTSDRHFPRDVLVMEMIDSATGDVILHTTHVELILAIKMGKSGNIRIDRVVDYRFFIERLS